MNWILRKMLGVAGSNPAFRRTARNLVAGVPALGALLSWLMARANADMIAAAGLMNSARPKGRVGAGFEDRDRLFRAARAIVARDRQWHGRT